MNPVRSESPTRVAEEGWRRYRGARSARKYREIPPIILSGVLGLVMAFTAYGRMVLNLI
jgi:hypothetical protein